MKLRLIGILTGSLISLIIRSDLVFAEDGPVYRLIVAGISCPFCAYGIEKKFSNIDGVEKIDLDIKTGGVTITMGQGKSLTKEIAEKATRDAGFSMRGFEQLNPKE